MDEKEKKRRMELCRNCYTCQQGISSDKTIDDVKAGEVEVSPAPPQDRAALCRKCYFCEQGVDKSVSIDDMKKQGKQPASEEERKRLCVNCFTCQQGVSPDVTADTRKGQPQKQDRRAELCRNCYTCQQGVDPTMTVDDMRAKGMEKLAPSFCWFLFPTNGCNLACKYCYANNQPGRMTKATMHKTLRWLFELQPHKQFTCHFFGGEPMVMWDMIEDMVQLGNAMAKNNNRKVTWSMTTNGTLLNKERLEFCRKYFRPGNPFLLSLDGRPKTHNKYRVFVNGKPSHHLIPVDDIIRMFPNIEVRPTIEPDTAKDWFEDFRWLRNKGFKAIAIEADYETSEWSEQQLADYECTLMKLGEYYVYAQRLEKPIYMKFIDSVRNILTGGQTPGGRMCGVAWNSGGIDHRGKLYACQRYASYNKPETYALGDVVNGWDEFKLFKTQSLYREQVCGDISKGFNCATCEVKDFCFKGCNAANRKIMGSRHISLPNYCTLSKIETRVALYVLGQLGILSAKQERGQNRGCKI